MVLAQGANSVGNSAWVQAEGLPIGEPHSPASCSVVLGADGAAWTNNAAARAEHGFMPEGRRLAEQVALARYVDDLIMVSKIWCSSCLEDMLTAMYRKPVQFDRQATCARGQPWLDMWVSFRIGEPWKIHMDGQEQEWVQCQASMPPAKTRLKPYLGDVAESLEALRLHVSGRTARLRQAGLDDMALRRAVQREILALALHGYPREAGDDASGLVQVPPIPRGCSACPHGAKHLGGGLPRLGPTQAGLDLGRARRTAVGSLTGHSL